MLPLTLNGRIEVRTTAGQLAIAANASLATETGKIAVIYAGGLEFRLASCAVDRNDQNEAEWIFGSNLDGDEVIIDIVSVVALKITNGPDSYQPL